MRATSSAMLLRVLIGSSGVSRAITLVDSGRSSYSTIVESNAVEVVPEAAEICGLATPLR